MEKILVIDDDVQLSELIKEFLGNFNYEVKIMHQPEIALKFLEKNHGEFKSIRIHDNFRKKGNGINVINHLITEAKKLSIIKLSIETGAGDFFKPARKLFKICGFEPCEPFAHYKEDVNSVYLSKLINNN